MWPRSLPFVGELPEGAVVRLADRSPEVDADALVQGLVPPPLFDRVSFDTYRPDPGEPSQSAALAALRAFA